MGTFHVTIEIAATSEGPFERVEALVDTGATYTVLPATLLRRLGVQPTDSQAFRLADGRRIERPLGELIFRIDGRMRTNIVVFGESETGSLLGALTLESFLLGVDPWNKRLIPVEGLMMSLGSGK